MIFAPQLELGGSPEKLGSPVKACRAPEATWPADILHEPLCIGRKAGRSVVLLADPDEVSRVLVEHEAEFPKWLPIYRHSAARETGSGTIFASQGADWAQLRRAIKPLFHRNRWRVLMEVSRRAALSARATCDIEDVETFFTAISVDVIVRTLVGDGPSADADYDIRAISQGLVDRQHAGDLGGAMGRIHSLADACMSRGPGAAAIPGVDWAGPTPERPRPMAEPYLAENRLALLYAGQETTALTMSWCFWVLGQDAALRESLRAECRAAIAASGGLSEAAVGRMPRLMAVMRETLRLMSPSSATVRSAASDTELCGQEIPAKSVIIIPIYAIHRHRGIWEDPDRFDPERFLTPAPHPMAFLPFAAGRHTCSAARSVLYEIAAVMATILDLCDWETLAPEEMGLTNKLVLSPSVKMRASVVERQDRSAFARA